MLITWRRSSVSCKGWSKEKSEGYPEMSASMFKRGDVLFAAVFSLVLILYNNLVNLLPQQLHDRWYVLMNLGFLTVLVLWTIVRRGIDRTALGLRWPESGRSALWGLGVGLLVTSPLFVLLAFPSFYSDKISDPRLSGLGASDLIYRAVVRIPLGTALFEEMAFRGLLYAALMRFGIVRAIWASSLVFALWHIMPTWELIQAGILADLSVPLKGMALVGGLLAT